MLANGAKLGYNTETAGAYTDLKTLKELSVIGSDPELIENTPIAAKNKQYELGVGDAGDLEFKFKWENTKEGSETRKLLEMCAAAKPVFWQLTLIDGTKYTFSATPSRKVEAGAINSVVDLVIKLALNSDLVESFAE